MKIVETTDLFPSHKYFTDVEEKFTKFTPQCRVLLARHFDEPNIFFTLRKRFDPGENKTFPNGGFEIFGPDGGLYNFELDEVVVHPFQLGMTKYFSNALNVNKEKLNTGPKGKRGRPKKDPSNLKILPKYVPTGGKRGRKPMSAEEKAKRELATSTKVKTGRRGRPVLSSEEKLKRELIKQKIARPVKKGRGRPRKV